MRRLKHFSLVFFHVLLLLQMANAQEARILSDQDLLRQHDFVKPVYQQKPTTFLLTKNSNILVRYNPVSLAFGSAMYIYQDVFSRQFSASCLYSPSCSQFSKQIILEYGLVKGIFLTADRLSRCNRIAVTDIHAAEFDIHDHKLHEAPLIYRLH